MAIPGTPGVAYTADGLEHTEAGIPSSQSRDHATQLDKRLRKLARYDYGGFWADIDGSGDAADIEGEEVVELVDGVVQSHRPPIHGGHRLVGERLGDAALAVLAGQMLAERGHAEAAGPFLVAALEAGFLLQEA